MRRLLSLAWIALLIGCAPVPSTPSPIPATGTSAPTETAAPSETPTPTIPSVTPTLETPSLTPTPDCDASSAVCVEDGHFFFQRPLASRYRRTADQYYLFGSTQSGSRQPHHGVDMPNAAGTPVMAAADGTVVFAGSDAQNPVSPWVNFYGNVVIIRHQFTGIQQPVFSLYGHLFLIEVAVGQTVRAGDEIGKVGATGVAIGSHLHFEVRVGENTYDASSNPALWLVPLGGTGVIAGRIVDMQGNLLHLTNIRLQFYPIAGSNYTGPAIQLETYGPEKDPVIGDAGLRENFAMGDLAAGRYRITFIDEGKLYERWVDIQAGKLSFVEFIVK